MLAFLKTIYTALYANPATRIRNIILSICFAIICISGFFWFFTIV